MKLYEITLTHLAPKDSVTAIKEYLVAENDDKVFEYLTSGEGKEYTYWDDKIDLEYWEEDCDEDEAEARLKEWIENTKENKNEDWNDNLYRDLYYGQTIYGWCETNIVDEEFMKEMIEKGIAKYQE